MSEDASSQKNVTPVKFQIFYASLFFGIFVFIVAVFIALILRHNSYNNEYDEKVLKELFHEYVKGIDDNFNKVRSRIGELRISAEFDLYESKLVNFEMPFSSRFIKEPKGEETCFTMDDIDDAHKAFVVANLTGAPPFKKSDPVFQRVVRMNLNLMDDFHGFKKSLPAIVYLYSITTYDTILMYPWTNSSEFKYSPDIYSYDLWKWSVPEKNPERKVLWTDSYWDDFNNGGLMTTCVAPVYDDDNFVAIVAADIMVDYLDSVVKKFEPTRAGEMIIFDRKQKLLAHPYLLSNKDRYDKSVADVVPKELKNCVQNVISSGKTSFTRAFGWDVFHASMKNAPFEVLYISPVSSTFTSLVKRMGWDVIILIGAMLTLLLGSLIVTHEKFIKPAEQFVNFILRRSQGEEFSKFPRVPKMWRTWFSTIDNVFEENVTLYGSLTKRNRELIQNNEELSRQIDARNRAEDEKKSLEHQLVRSEKMRVIGQLAGGIAHDFNNQLSIILNTARILRNKQTDELQRDKFDRILTASRRSADLVSQLLAFSRQGKYSVEPVNMHSLIDEVENLLRHSIDKRISFKKELLAKKVTVSGDSTQLQNALLNMAINARDAMPQGGTLTFQTTDVVFAEETNAMEANYLPAGEYLKICVSDTGIGMDEETKSRVFEPFFSTKASKGLGMGLAAVYGTIQSHNGTIEVGSTPGDGTTFTILLPLRLDSEKVKELKDETLDKKEIICKKNILLVDDERDVCLSISDALAMFGFNVVFYENSSQAVDYYRKSWREIDLVLLDMIMPNMDGRETFLEMKKINPSARAMVFTGYSMDGEAQEILKDGAVAILQKPLEPNLMAQKIMEQLEE